MLSRLFHDEEETGVKKKTCNLLLRRNKILIPANVWTESQTGLALFVAISEEKTPLAPSANAVKQERLLMEQQDGRGRDSSARQKRCYLRSFEISGVLKIKVQIKPSHVSGSLSISEGKKPRTSHRKRQRLGERSMLLPQQDKKEEDEEEEGEQERERGVVPGSKKKKNQLRNVSTSNSRKFYELPPLLDIFLHIFLVSYTSLSSFRPFTVLENSQPKGGNARIKFLAHAEFPLCAR